MAATRARRPRPARSRTELGQALRAARATAALLALLAAALVVPDSLVRAQGAAVSPAFNNAVSVPAPSDTDAPPVTPLPEPSAAAVSASTTPPPPDAAALPAGSGTLDSATVQRIVERLVTLHFLTTAADAQDADTLAEAIRGFQASAGISPSGTLDRDTVGRLTTP